MVTESWLKQNLLKTIQLPPTRRKNAKIGLKLASYATDNKVTFTDLKLLEGNIYNLVNAALDYFPFKSSRVYGKASESEF